MISIIIATFNAGKHIRECLLSISKQSYKNIEVIIIDGGSKDNTRTVIEEFKYLTISGTSEKDSGIYEALNKGIKLAKGKWVYFMGADDRLLPGFSELAGKMVEEQTVYYGNSEPFYNDYHQPGYILLSGKFSKYRLAKYCINHQAIIYPAAVFKKYSYDLQYKVFADYALNIAVWGDVNFNRKYYPVSIALYNMNGFSSLNNDYLFKKDKPVLIRKYMGLLVYSRFLFKQYKKRLLGQPE